MTAAGLQKISGKDIAITVDRHAGKRVIHADVIVGRDGLMAHGGVLRVHWRPGFWAEHYRLAFEGKYARLRHQPGNSIDIRIEQPQPGIHVNGNTLLVPARPFVLVAEP